jgi:hypothetical protein
MANLTTSVHFKPTVAFNRGDTFVFGASVYTADGAGSFQHRLPIQPNPKTGFVTLPEVVTGVLAGKFGEISLFNHHADFELESASNTNSTSPWAIACKPAAQPSQAIPSPRERSARGPRILSRARTGAPLRAGPARSPTRVQLGLRRHPRSRSGLQPSLRVLLEPGLRVRLRVGP